MKSNFSRLNPSKPDDGRIARLTWPQETERTHHVSGWRWPASPPSWHTFRD